MLKELKEKWIEALRSGEYRQGLGVLRNKNDEFCCLGVLCNIMNPNGWTHNTGLLLCPHRFVGPNFSSTTGIDDKEILGNSIAEKLTEMNDQDELSFDEIADWIEEELVTDEI